MQRPQILFQGFGTRLIPSQTHPTNPCTFWYTSFAPTHLPHHPIHHMPLISAYVGIQLYYICSPPSPRPMLPPPPSPLYLAHPSLHSPLTVVIQKPIQCTNQWQCITLMYAICTYLNARHEDTWYYQVISATPINIITCLVSRVHFSCIVQYSLYHNTDMGTMWHCTLVSSTPSQSIGLFFGGVRCSGVECY